MAVLGRLLVSSAERLDLPDFLSIDSFTQGDFKYLMRSFVGGDNPYILTGFDVINPGAAIGTQNISIRVADSVVYHPGSLAGPFFHGLEEGNIQAAPLVPELRKNATNYVYLTLTTTEAAKDTRAFWDTDKEAGEGGEFTQDVNTQSVLSVDVNVSVSAFPDNTVPVCKVVVGANFIESIEDARNMMFRLGSGGLSPNPLSRYDFRNAPSSTYARTEPNTLMSNSLDPNSFQGGDKNIKTLKEWMDVVMTKLLELSGTTYWYEDTASFSLIEAFKDALATSIKSKGVWQSSNVTPGLLTWTEDIILQSVSDKKDIIVRSGNKTLLDGQVMYIDQNRGEEINTGSVSVEWFNATNYVNGSLGSFENLTKGDWVKKAGDPDYRYLRVEEFYAAANLAGGVTSAGNALSIKLSDVYGGISEITQGVYVQGEYLTTDIQVAERSDVALTDAGGDLYWLAMRSDKIIDISDITTTTLSVNIEEHDGAQAKCTSVGHGLQDKQRISISGSTNFDGEYQVEVETSDVFYIKISGGPHADELAQSAFYATVTTEARTTDNGYQLESANHTFDLDQKVIITDTTNYNNTYQVFPITDTTFSIPVTSAIANELDGTATSVNIYVRTDLGPTKITQGENKGIGEVETENILSYIGMDSIAQTSPLYNVPTDYSAINGYVNYNSSADDTLTDRVSKLTAMMADKAQDKNVNLHVTGADLIRNLGGAQQTLFFDSFTGGTPEMTITVNGSTIGTVDLTNTFSFNANEAAYVTIDRNADFAISVPTVAPIKEIPIDENTFVIATRLSGLDLFLWDGTCIYADETISWCPFHRRVIRQNLCAQLIEGGTWSWDLGTNTLSWDADAYIQVPGALADRNTISAGSVVLSGSGQCAFVDINRVSGIAQTRAVNSANTATINLSNDDRIVIAYRVGDEVHVMNNLLARSEAVELSNQNDNIKLIEGGTWSWDSGTNQLINSASAFAQIPGLASNVNEISAQTISLISDGQCAYISLKRTAGASTRTVNVADIASVPIDGNTLIIARRSGSNIYLGDGFYELTNGSIWQINENLNVGGDVVIEGDLTVNGTTTTVNSDTLDVADANITVNSGGNQASADLNDAGLTVEMSDATDAVIGYDSTVQSKFKLGESGSESEVITADHTQSMNNKTIVAATLQGATQLDDPIEEEIQTDATTTGATATISTVNSPIIRLTNASLTSLAAIASQVSGKVLTIMNVTGNPVQIENDNGATAAQSILTGTGGTVVLNDDASIIVKYDDTSSRWRIIGGTGSGSGGGGGLDVYFTETFETTGSGDFTTGNNATFDNGGILDGTLSDEATNPISGDSSLKYTMGSTSTNDWFKSPVINLEELKKENKIPENFTGVTVYYTYNGDNEDIRFVGWDETNSAELAAEVSYFKTATKSTRFAVSMYVPSGVTELAYGGFVVTGNSGKVLILDEIEFTTNPFVANNDLVTYEYNANTCPSAKPSTNSFSVNFTNVVENTIPAGVATVTNDSTDGVILTAHQYFEVVAEGMFALDSASTANTFLLNGDSSVSINDASNDDKRHGRAQNAAGQPNDTVVTKVTMVSGDTLKLGGSNNAINYTGGSNQFQYVKFTITASNEQIVAYSSRNAEDLVVEGEGNGNTALTADVTNVDWTEVSDNYGVWDGNTLFVEETGIYYIQASMVLSSSVTNNIKLFKNGSLYAIMSSYISATLHSGSTIVYLEKGDFVNLRVTTGATLSNSTNHKLSISKLGQNSLVGLPTTLVGFVKDVKPSGTDGGTATSGSYQVRDLNTIEGDFSKFGTLSSNQFTLDAGIYLLEAECPGRRVGNHKASIYNVSDSAYDAYGSVESSVDGADSPSTTKSKVYAKLTLTESKTFELRHQCSTTRATDGRGQAASFGDGEIYSQIKITKLA